MRILMVASEARPHAKTGGLADVLGSLPSALARLGHDVDVILPRYRGVDPGTPLGRLDVRVGGQVDEAELSEIRGGGARTILVRHDAYFDREYLYGAVGRDYPDNPERFAFLSQAALAWAGAAERPYDVVHAHDWQAGLLPLLVLRAELGARRPATVLTIHNLAYQGVFDASWLPRLGLEWELMRVTALEYWSRISYLKAGVVFADLVTTVSPTYAAEILTPEFGFGFDGILRGRAADLVGILNGIDYDQWDPWRDPHLPVPFRASKMQGKTAAKRKVLEAFGLPATSAVRQRPLVGLISRMVDQKGFDLLDGVMDVLPAMRATFVLLGSGEARYEDGWRALAAAHPDRVGVRIGFDEPLAHVVEAGADVFLMPSRFEPCGLNQMFSQRYGTVPVVHATGGLRDTVRDAGEGDGGTGFTFGTHTPAAMLGALGRALVAFEDRAAWRRIQRAGMRRDFSWDAPAREYVKVYERAVEQGRGPGPGPARSMR